MKVINKTVFSKKIVLVALLSAAVIGCNSDSDKKKSSSLANYKGSWVEQGTGLAVDIGDKSVEL